MHCNCRLVVDGLRSLWRGNPNMNSLVGLGCLASYGIGALSVAMPSLALDTSFLEEPIMLLGVVLLGRTLEARAKVKQIRPCFVLSSKE